MIRGWRRNVEWVAVVLAVLTLVGACSSGDGDEDASEGSSDSSALSAPAFGGSFQCTDESGDQLDGEMEAETVTTTPIPGTDLVEAEVEVVGDELVVRFTTEGLVTVDDEPRFVVAKGVPEQPATWFEVRAYVKDGKWVAERRRMPTQLNAVGAAQERIDMLTGPVDVVANTVSIAVPVDQLPTIDGTPTWQFGSSARGGAVFDDCNELTS